MKQCCGKGFSPIGGTDKGYKLPKKKNLRCELLIGF